MIVCVSQSSITVGSVFGINKPFWRLAYFDIYFQISVLYYNRGTCIEYKSLFFITWWWIEYIKYTISFGFNLCWRYLGIAF